MACLDDGGPMVRHAVLARRVRFWRLAANDGRGRMFPERGTPWPFAFPCRTKVLGVGRKGPGGPVRFWQCPLDVPRFSQLQYSALCCRRTKVGAGTGQDGGARPPFHRSMEPSAADPMEPRAGRTTMRTRSCQSPGIRPCRARGRLSDIAASHGMAKPNSVPSQPPPSIRYRPCRRARPTSPGKSRRHRTAWFSL